MPQPYMNNSSMKKRTSVLVFLRGAAAPLVLYVDNPQLLYEELSGLLKKRADVLVEKQLNGPIRKVCFNTADVIAAAMQEEQYV